MKPNDRTERFTLSSAKGLKIIKAPDPGVVETALSRTDRITNTSITLRAKTFGDLDNSGRCFVLNAKDQSTERVARLIAVLMKERQKAGQKARLKPGDQLVVINSGDLRSDAMKLRLGKYGRKKSVHVGRKRNSSDAALSIKVRKLLSYDDALSASVSGVHICLGTDHPFTQSNMETVVLPKQSLADRSGRHSKAGRKALVRANKH